MQNNLTIIVTTYKRYDYLKRLLSFYFSYNIDINIVVLDSTPYYPHDEELIDFLSHHNVDWRRYDADIFFAYKIADGVNYIETDYAVLCADDDFLIPPSLEECVNFLINNLDYTSAHGLYFLHHNSKYEFYLSPLYNKGRSSEHDHASARVTSYLSGENHYYPMYAVHRTPMLQMSWNETKKYVCDEGLSELFPCSISLSHGKMKVLPIFYSSREPNDFSWTDGFLDEINAKIYSDNKIRNAVTGIGKHLSMVDSIDIEEAESIALHAFQRQLRDNEIKSNLIKSNNTKLQHNIALSAAVSVRKYLKLKVRLRNIIDKVMNRGCPSSIYPNYLDDYLRVKYYVKFYGLTLESINVSRKELFERLSTDD